MEVETKDPQERSSKNRSNEKAVFRLLNALMNAGAPGPSFGCFGDSPTKLGMNPRRQRKKMRKDKSENRISGNHSVAGRIRHLIPTFLKEMRHEYTGHNAKTSPVRPGIEGYPTVFCPHCGSRDGQWRGTRRANGHGLAYRRHCKRCGRWHQRTFRQTWRLPPPSEHGAECRPAHGTETPQA
jgi:hypothetical protein